MAIQNPNSCGQGHDPFYINHPFTALVLSYGYAYSHSTPITALDRSVHIHHTFRLGEHNVGLDENQPNTWETSCGSGSGHHWRGKGFEELKAHLRSKNRRYFLRKKTCLHCGETYPCRGVLQGTHSFKK